MVFKLPMNAAVLRPLEQAILQTVAYADVFDYPLRLPELHRYLIGQRAPPTIVWKALSSESLVPFLTRTDGYVSFRDREHLVHLRREREEVARQLWPHAVRYGHLIGRLPFVRMVAVTGALAVNNVEPGADIDYLVVTEPGRLWICRAFVIGLVRLVRRHGVELCPNYFLSTRALAIPDRNLFTAHELTQMVPLTGMAVYRRLRTINRWTSVFLPNADGPPPASPPNEKTNSPWGLLPSQVAERLLRTSPGCWLEEWEMNRKVRKFRAQANGNPEAAFAPDWCKGHFDGYGRRTLRAYRQRLTRLGLE